MGAIAVVGHHWSLVVLEESLLQTILYFDFIAIVLGGIGDVSYSTHCALKYSGIDNSLQTQIIRGLQTYFIGGV